MNSADLFLKIEMLPEAMKKEVKDLVEKLFQQNGKKDKHFKRKIGCGKGMFKMADDFTAPLDDLKDYMY